MERRCTSSAGYVRSPREGSFERERPLLLEFLPTDVAVAAFDTVVTLKVEVIDAEGRYASDERAIWCPAPAAWAGE